MITSSLLRDKRAVVFGAGGSIGSAVAAELAAEGAEVFLAGRTASSVELVAQKITDAGGQVHAQTVDALDAAAVDAYVDSVVRQAGSIDIELNATGPRVSEYSNGTPALGLSVDQFMTPVETVLRSQFITARATARHMVEHGGGVIIFLTGSPAKPHGPGTSGIGAAFGAIENLTRTMAIELGAAGIRVVCMRTAANPDSRTIHDTVDAMAKILHIAPEHAAAAIAEGRVLNTSPTTQDTARAVAFLASERARMMTGAVLNASAGVVTD
jgi:NAD(P)-dependent dehydrogenase (short-subunit alcohol dehydrogenase family)